MSAILTTLLYLAVLGPAPALPAPVEPLRELPAMQDGAVATPSLAEPSAILEIRQGVFILVTTEPVEVEPGLMVALNSPIEIDADAVTAVDFKLPSGPPAPPKAPAPLPAGEQLAPSR